MPDLKTDFLIVGGGIIGLALARSLLAQKPGAKITVIEKESEIAWHASGRNSGVLHAGFYYTADSLKARFTVDGNRAMRAYCQERNLPLNNCGKLVVARNESELEGLHELERRGKRNGSNIKMISAEEARELEPNAKTHKLALYSPDTASVDPALVCKTLGAELVASGVNLKTGCEFFSHAGNLALTSAGEIQFTCLINAAGLYADKLAHMFGFGRDFTIIPFKGIYLKYGKNKTDIGMHIYRVPNLQNPFLEVHFTKTVDGGIKIGPTAIPAFWRENYDGLARFSLPEFLSIAAWESRLFLQNAFGFRNLAIHEVKKYIKAHFIELGAELVQYIDPQGFSEFAKPGIRAQLLNKRTLELVQDFVIEGDSHSVHILNAVSPGFTCSFPFADYVVQHHIKLHKD